MLFSCFASAAENQPFELGKIVDPVVVNADHTRSYALYLPTHYDPGRKWPILYCFDARERGKVPAGLFQTAAEKYGYIIASSNNTRSDDPKWPNLEIIKALWQDTHARFSIDDQRVYTSGFSGGARFAWGIGQLLKGAVAGVIGCGAGIHTDYPPNKDLPFVYFGTVGTTDFNYYEVNDLDHTLESLGVPHQVRIFEGGHDWAPEWLATRALEWMTIRAIKAGKAEKSAPLIANLYNIAIQEAAESETKHHDYEAMHLYKSIADDFSGLTDASIAEKKLESYRNSPTVQAAQKRMDKDIAGSNQYSDAVTAVIREMRSNSPEPHTLGRVMQDLQIGKLKKDAHGKDPEDARYAQRLLEIAYVQFIYYYPQDCVQRHDYRQALDALAVAGEIKEDDPRVDYNIASVYAKKGDKKKAIDSLNKSLHKGFKNVDYLQQDPDFAGIRDEEDFKKIVEQLKMTKSGS